MLDLKLLQKHPEVVAKALADRHSNISVDAFLPMDERRRAVLTEVETLKSKRNADSAEVARKKRAGEDASELLADLGKLSDRIKELDAEASEIKDKVSELMDRAERFQHLNPFNPFEITVEAGSICDGRTLAEVNFWQNTTPTVIAIAHGGELMISPGASTQMQAGDVVYFVGDENAPARVDRFVKVGA